MLTLTEHLATSIITDENLSDDELRHEFHLMAIRNQAAAELVRGEISVDIYENILFECGVDPISWLKVAEENINNDPNYAIPY